MPPVSLWYPMAGLETVETARALLTVTFILSLAVQFTSATPPPCNENIIYGCTQYMDHVEYRTGVNATNLQAGSALIHQELQVGSGSTPLLVANNGRLGVGKASPAVELDIAGSLSATGGMNLTGSNPLIQSTTAGATLRLDAPGGVRITETLATEQTGVRIDGVLHLNTPLTQPMVCDASTVGTLYHLTNTTAISEGVHNTLQMCVKRGAGYEWNRFIHETEYNVRIKELEERIAALKAIALTACD